VSPFFDGRTAQACGTPPEPVFRTVHAPPPARMNIGCGPCTGSGWLNADLHPGEGIDLECDIRQGVPLPEETFDYIVGMHMLQDLPYPDVLPALKELRRLLKREGVLRLGLPDLDKALQAYQRDDHRYFHVPDSDATDLGAKLITQIIWYGSVRTPMTYGFIQELILRAGFREARRCLFRATGSPYADIVVLDNRERESLFVEAVR
jgi:SAM-dependent methyltransferase